MLVIWAADTGQMKPFIFTLAAFANLFSCLGTRKLSCVYHEGRTLSCSDAESQQPLSSCFICKSFKGWKCEKLIQQKVKCNITEISDRCELTRQGQYDDHTEFAVIFTRLPSNTPTCQQMILRDLVKPGPVRFLKVEAINGTALAVSWNKSNDFDNSKMTYQYKIVVETAQTKQEVTIASSKVLNERVVQLAIPWENVSVTVTGRMDIGGFYGASATTYISKSLPSVLPVSEEAASIHVLYIVIGLICPLFAAFVLAWCYRNKKTLCRTEIIDLPPETEKNQDNSHKLRPADIPVPMVMPKRASKDESTPQPDSGRGSMETSDEDSPLVPNADLPNGEPHSRPPEPSASKSKEVTESASACKQDQASSSNPDQASASDSQPPASSQRADNSGQDDWLDGSAVSSDRWIPRSELRRSSRDSNQSWLEYGDPQIGILGESVPLEFPNVERSQVSNDNFIPFGVKCQNPDSRVPHFLDTFLKIPDDHMNVWDKRDGHDNADDIELRSNHNSHIPDVENQDSATDYAKLDASDDDIGDILSLISSVSASSLSDVESISSYTGFTITSSDNQV